MLLQLQVHCGIRSCNKFRYRPIPKQVIHHAPYTFQGRSSSNLACAPVLIYTSSDGRCGKCPKGKTQCSACNLQPYESYCPCLCIFHPHRSTHSERCNSDTEKCGNSQVLFWLEIKSGQVLFRKLSATLLLLFVCCI